MEMPQMTMQVLEMKLEREWQEKAENLWNQPIGQIIEEQNMPVPVERWSLSSIMLQTQYLGAMVYYFVYAEANPDQNMTNKGVGLFKASPSNLHKLVSGKKYHTGSHGDIRKASSLKELEEHGEPMVQVIKKKMVKPTTSVSGTSKSGGKAGKVETSGKVTVTKTTPKIIPLPFLDNEMPASGTRGASKKKKEGNE